MISFQSSLAKNVAVFHVFRDLPLILKSHALGSALLTTRSLDSHKRKLLVDILANNMIIRFARQVTVTLLEPTAA